MAVSACMVAGLASGATDVRMKLCHAESAVGSIIVLL